MRRSFRVAPAPRGAAARIDRAVLVVGVDTTLAAFNHRACCIPGAEESACGLQGEAGPLFFSVGDLVVVKTTRTRSGPPRGVPIRGCRGRSSIPTLRRRARQNPARTGECRRQPRLLRCICRSCRPRYRWGRFRNLLSGVSSADFPDPVLPRPGANCRCRGVGPCSSGGQFRDRPMSLGHDMGEP